MLLLFVNIGLNAQKHQWNRMALSTEYRYLGRNVLGLGLEYRVPHKDEMTFNIGAKAFYTHLNGTPKIVPQINAEYGMILLGGISITPYAIEPQVSFNFMNLLAINTGYAIPIDKNNYFRGITFGIKINIGVSRDSQYYQKFDVGF